jgi:putative ABC transport system substrate-binding protein
MKRREFIGLVGGATVWPLAAHAQQAERVRRVGILLPGARDGPFRTFAVLSQALAEHGWHDGRNIKLEYRWADADLSRMQVLAKELVALDPDLIVASSCE